MVAMLSLQSCVEIVEEIAVNNDLSGKMSVSLGIGQGKSLIDLIGQFAHLSMVNEAASEAGKIINVLKQQQGISHVVFERSRKGGNMQLSFDFDNHKNLNRALYAISGNKKNLFNPAIYKLKKNRFIKNNMTSWAKLMMKANKAKMPDEVLFDLVEITTIVHLPEPVKSFSGKGIQVSSDKLTLTTSHDLSDILEKNINTGMRVRF